MAEGLKLVALTFDKDISEIILLCRLRELFTTPYSSEPANALKGFSKCICGHKNNLTLMISTSNL